jgi:hypothetical protein
MDMASRLASAACDQDQQHCQHSALNIVRSVPRVLAGVANEIVDDY